MMTNDMCAAVQTAGRLLILLPAVTTAFAGAGCSAADAGNEVDNPAQQTQAFSEAKCLQASADFTNRDVDGNYTSFIDVSPATYNNPSCFRARVYDLRDAFNKSRHRGSAFTALNATYAEPGPFTQAECEATNIGLQVYADMGSSAGGTRTPTWQLLDMQAPIGVWSNGLCVHPVATIPIPAHAVGPTDPPWLYHVDATARHADNSTASVAVQSGPCGQSGQYACGNTICFTGTPVREGLLESNTRFVCEAAESTAFSCSPVSGYSESITLSNTGDWSYTTHAHNSGTFTVNYLLGMISFNTYEGQFIAPVPAAGVLGGIVGPSRTQDTAASGNDSMVARNWHAIKQDLQAMRWTCRQSNNSAPNLPAVFTELGFPAFSEAHILSTF